VDNNRALGARVYPSGPRHPAGFHGYRVWPGSWAATKSPAISVPLLQQPRYFSV